jgi:hypothetical protein
LVRPIDTVFDFYDCFDVGVTAVFIFFNTCCEAVDIATVTANINETFCLQSPCFIGDGTSRGQVPVEKRSYFRSSLCLLSYVGGFFQEKYSCDDSKDKSGNDEVLAFYKSLRA